MSLTGSNPHPEDDNYCEAFDPDNFNRLEAKPVRTDKTATNVNMDLVRVTEERAYTSQEMTKTRMEFQQTDLDTGTQCILDVWSKEGHNLILKRAEIVQLQPITTDGKCNQQLRAFGKHNINTQRSLFDWGATAWRLKWFIPNILSPKHLHGKQQGKLLLT